MATNRILWAVCAVLTAFALSGSAYAGTIYSDCIQFLDSANNLRFPQNGILPAGMTLDSGLNAFCAAEDPSDADPPGGQGGPTHWLFNFSSTAFPNHKLAAQPFVTLIEGNVFSSDQIVALDDGTTLTIDFCSDTEDPQALIKVCGSNPNNNLAEKGDLSNFQDITTYLFVNNSTNPAPFTVKVFSDSDTPEPATFALIVPGLLFTTCAYLLRRKEVL